MKHFILIFFLSTFVVTPTIAQTTEIESIILGVPNNSFGYLIWDTQIHDSRRAMVEIIETDLATSQINSVSKIEILGAGYTMIDKQYWNYTSSDKYYSAILTVYGSNNNDHTEIISMVPEGGGGIPLCSWTCHSANYAYSIAGVEFGNYAYSIQPAYQVVNDIGQQIPFYRYFSHDEFAHYAGMLTASDEYEPTEGVGDPNFHEMGEWNQDVLFGDDLKMMRFENSIDVNYLDINGNVIFGQYVYAIAKGRGHWRPNFGGSQTIAYGLTHNYCDDSDQTTFTMIDFMNNETDPDVPLACQANNGGATIVGDYDPDLDGCIAGCEQMWNLTQTSTPYWEINIDENNNVTYTVEWDYVYDIIGSSFCCDASVCPLMAEDACEDSPINGLSGSTAFLEHIEFMSITSYQNGAENILNVTGMDLFDDDGSPTIPSLVLEEGLHKAVVKYPGRTFDYIYFQVKGSGVETMPLKDFFSATIYPNPITDEFYNVEMNASANLKFEYQTFNSQGNLLETRKLEIKNGHNASHKFNLPSGYNDGVLIHKFTFEDGSFDSISTLK